MTVKRDCSIDILKGILILLVILGHSGVKFSHVIFWFHMPLFFVISGYLLHIPDKQHEKIWMIRKFKQLMLPYVVYSFILGSLEIVNGPTEVWLYWVKTLYGGKSAQGVYWFITVLLTSQCMITFLWNRVKSTKILSQIFILMYIIGTVISKIYVNSNGNMLSIIRIIPWDLDVCLLAMPYIAIGILLKQNMVLIKSVIKTLGQTGTIITEIFMFIILGWFLYKSKASEWFVLDMKNSIYTYFILDLLVPLVVGIILIRISHVLKNVWGSGLSYIGQRTIPIMYLHMTIRAVFLRLYGEHYSVMLYILVTIIITLLFEKLIACYFPSKLCEMFGVKKAIRVTDTF